jgi:hypothetical protein
LGLIVCGRCGKENLDHYKFCLGCGGDLAARAAAGSAAQAEAALGATFPGGGGHAALGATPGHAAVEPTTRGVGGRGAPQKSAEPAGETRPCPNCGNIVPVEFVFCGQCGTRLGGQPEKQARGPILQAPVSAPSVRGKLVLIRPDGNEGGFLPLLDGDTPVGRASNVLFESDSYLSPRHAVFVLHGDKLLVRDLDSLNGVFVKMTAEEEIADGEVVRMGQELLRFNVIHPPEPLDDGTEVMGSPNPGYWGRMSLIISREQDGAAYPLYGDSMVVGRERGDILFPEDGYVSGTHARISHRDGRYWLADLNSSNGSFIRVRGERGLTNGSFLLMGQQLFRVQYT